MQIEKLTLTDKEVAEAVGEYLDNRFGIRVEVEQVKKEYTWEDGYTIIIRVEKKDKPAPSPATRPMSEQDLKEDAAIAQNQ